MKWKEERELKRIDDTLFSLGYNGYIVLPQVMVRLREKYFNYLGRRDVFLFTLGHSLDRVYLEENKEEGCYKIVISRPTEITRRFRVL